MKTVTYKLEGMEELLSALLHQRLAPEQALILIEGREEMRKTREADEQWREEKKRQFDESAPVRDADKRRFEEETLLAHDSRLALLEQTRLMGEQTQLLKRVAEGLERLCEKVEKLPPPIVFPSRVPQSPTAPVPNPYPYGPYGPWVLDKPYTITFDGTGGYRVCTSGETPGT